MAITPGTGQSLPPLTCKTWVLKVSIHCEACKRKVKKVLQSVEGVKDVDIDINQQKVTVTCNVEAETLINKLIKSNKHAELWPETAERRERRPGKSKKREKQIDPENKIADQQKEPMKEKSTQTVEIAQSSAKKREANLAHAPKNNANSSDNTLKIIDGDAKKSGSGSGSGGQAMELKSEGKKPETGSASNQPPATEEKGVGNDGEAEPTGKGCTGKNKRGKKGPLEREPSNTGVPTSIRSTNTLADSPESNHSPPYHGGYQYPLHYQVPQPVYAVSYNTAPPSSSYTAYYHASPPPYSYAHTHPGAEAHPPPSDLEFYPRQPLDSFELFSDENPNGCSIM